LDELRAGIDGILHEFFDHRSWTLNDFTGSDLIRNVFRKKLNDTHSPTGMKWFDSFPTKVNKMS
jgi:hypothetical protein